jgi:two-component sensor histidine kinase
MMTFDGRAESVGDARRFVAKTFGDCPGSDLALLVASELAGNAVQHSRSGQPGGRFTLHLAAFEDRWRIRVDDGGGPAEPSVKAEADQDEAGRGLALVAALSADWGVLGDHYARAVWAEILKPPERAS